MEWISVKDRLPEIKEGYHAAKVIVAEYDPCDQSYSVHDCMFGKYPKNSMWPASEKNDFMSLYIGTETVWGPVPDIVTHWMPLPEPPSTPPEYIVEQTEN